MEVFYLSFILVYALILWAIKGHWNGKDNLPHPEKIFTTALLIPFRNESRHLPVLLSNLEKLIAPSPELIFINDHSKDGSKDLIESFLLGKNLNWTVLENSGIGKKAALTTGIPHAKAEIIMTTDADCLLPNDWHRRMSHPFYLDHIQVVAGPVMTASGRGFFSEFQQIEWASILLVTQYLFSKRQPLMCSGANFAYRKSAFKAVGGYAGNEKHLSGDDEFLLKKMIRKFGVQSAAYLNQEEVLVKTQPMAHLGVFLQQRVRWASKWRLHRSAKHASVALGSYIVAMVQLGSFFLIFGNGLSKIVFLVFWTLKIIVEKKVLDRVLHDYAVHPTLFSFIKTSFVHPVYIISVGLLSIRGKFTWKGRKSNYNV